MSKMSQIDEANTIAILDRIGGGGHLSNNRFHNRSYLIYFRA